MNTFIHNRLINDGLRSRSESQSRQGLRKVTSSRGRAAYDRCEGVASQWLC